MRRLFKEFIKTYKKRLSYRDLTIEFNKWVGQERNKYMPTIPRFNFKAYTNKFMVRKWCEKLEINVKKSI